MMTTGSDDQQSLTAVTAVGEEVVSEASDVDEPANAEGQFTTYHDYTVSIKLYYIRTTSILINSHSICSITFILMYSNIFTQHVYYIAVSLNDVKDIEDPLNKVEAGLVGGDIPLQSVHIKAKLLDLAAQVITSMTTFMIQ